jgi:CRP/FNR family transcriptional regulator, cyclic AMP receptor protein
MTPWRDPLPRAPERTFWSLLDEADRKALATAGAVRRVATGTRLAEEGSPPDQVHVLLSGRAEVFRLDPAGHRTVLAIRTAGDVLGELSAIDGLPMSATAVALEPGAALVVAATRFAALWRERRTLAQAVTTAVMYRLRASDDSRIRQRADVRDRTVLALLDLAGPGTGPALVRITQQRLADLVSAALVSVTRTLDELREQGAIRTARGRIEILDPARLRALLPPELR